MKLEEVILENPELAEFLVIPPPTNLQVFVAAAGCGHLAARMTTSS